MLDSLHIKNFRCFEDLTIPSLGRVNLIVGKNNSGKSTLLEAIMLFAQRGRKNAWNDIANIRGEAFYQISSRMFFYTKIGDISQKNFISYEPAANHLHHYADLHGNEIILFIHENGKFIEGYSIDRGNFPTVKNHPFSFIRTTIYQEKELAEAWDEIRIKRKDTLLKDALRIIDEKIDDVFYTTKQVTMIHITDEEQARSIKSMGEGVSRILQIFLYAFQARGGYLMIDEFENGLHYSIQEEVWEKLFKLAKEFDIQVFATTHSEDTIKAFCKVALKSDEEGRLIALGRSPAPEDNDRIVAIAYDEKEIAVISKTGMEVR